jgi:hypothetical protein
VTARTTSPERGLLLDMAAQVVDEEPVTIPEQVAAHPAWDLLIDASRRWSELHNEGCDLNSLEVRFRNEEYLAELAASDMEAALDELLGGAR